MLHQQVLTVDPAAEAPLAAVDEVQAVVLNVKTDHVATEHSLEDLVRPWEQSEYVPRWEWDVEEEAQLKPQILVLGRLSDPVRG